MTTVRSPREARHSAASDGTVIWGPVVDDRIGDVSATLGAHRPTWSRPQSTRAAGSDRGGRRRLDRTRRRRSAPPDPDSGPHHLRRRQLCRPRSESDRAAEPPGHPVLFTRFASSLVGHGQPIERPAVSHQFDWEGELGRGDRADRPRRRTRDAPSIMSPATRASWTARSATGSATRASSRRARTSIGREPGARGS